MVVLVPNSAPNRGVKCELGSKVQLRQEVTMLKMTPKSENTFFLTVPVVPKSEQTHPRFQVWEWHEGLRKASGCGYAKNGTKL